MSEINIDTVVKLADGNKIPVLGYRTFELNGKDAYRGVTSALETGYRHIDSAAWYENEKEVGTAILDFCKETGTARSTIFYTTKLKLNNGYANVKQAIQRSLDACGLGYIDLYLIHGPLGGPNARMESWRAVCDFQRKSGGLLRSIGISTFGISHMKELVKSGLPLPVVHQVCRDIQGYKHDTMNWLAFNPQIDLHPFMVRSEIVAFSKKYNMVLAAWAPLVRGLRFNHPQLVLLSHKYNKKPSQILLRYSLQKGYVPLPKSVSKQRIIENSQVFDFQLSEDDVSSLDKLDEGMVIDWDPTDCE